MRERTKRGFHMYTYVYVSVRGDVISNHLNTSV